MLGNWLTVWHHGPQMVPAGESGQDWLWVEFETEPFTGGLERMRDTKTHGHPQSRK